MDLFMEELEEAGVDLAVIQGMVRAERWGRTSNDDIAELIQKYPGKFVGIGAVNGLKTREALQELERISQIDGMRGVALDSGSLDTPAHHDDPRLDAIYEACQDLGLVVSVVASAPAGPDLEYANPVHIQRVANRFRDLRIFIAHGAFPWITHVLSLASITRNVWISPDFYHFAPGMPGQQQWVEAAEGIARHRLVYASSYPVRDLKQSREQFQSFSFSKEALERATSLNAAEWLGLDP